MHQSLSQIYPPARPEGPASPFMPQKRLKTDGKDSSSYRVGSSSRDESSKPKSARELRLLQRRLHSTVRLELEFSFQVDRRSVTTLKRSSEYVQSKPPSPAQITSTTHGAPSIHQQGMELAVRLLSLHFTSRLSMQLTLNTQVERDIGAVIHSSMKAASAYLRADRSHNPAVSVNVYAQTPINPL